MNAISKICSFLSSFIVYKYHCGKAKKVDYFDYEKLANPQFISPTSFTSVTLYGNYKAVAHLRHKRFNFATEYLEHGVCFLDYPESAELLGYVNRVGIKTIYTFGEWRKKILEQYLQNKKLKRQVVAVGPYILGAKNFKSPKELAKVKSQLGKTLTVFPSHSTETNQTNYNENLLINEINRIKSDFDNVLICMYWKDVLDRTQEIELYKSNGYKIVTAGHRSDPKFLERLRDIIELSDTIMTNGLGSHIGYAVCLNRPVYFFNQNTTNKTDYNLSSFNQITYDCKKIFCPYPAKINDEQISFVQKYWGKW